MRVHIFDLKCLSLSVFSWGGACLGFGFCIYLFFNFEIFVSKEQPLYFVKKVGVGSQRTRDGDCRWSLLATVRVGWPAVSHRDLSDSNFPALLVPVPATCLTLESLGTEPRPSLCRLNYLPSPCCLYMGSSP